MDKLDYFIGLDLGQASEFTAVAVVEKTHPARNPFTGTQAEATYAVRHLERFPLGTSYPDLFRRVLAMFAKPPLQGSMLVVDQTGVCKAVIQMLRQAKTAPRLTTMTIVTGLVAAADGHGGWLVPKKDLIGSLQVLLQTRRLQIAESQPEASILVNELLNFQIKPKTMMSTDPIVDWRESVRDDLVFAVGIAIWQAERRCSWNGWLARPEVWGGGW